MATSNSTGRASNDEDEFADALFEQLENEPACISEDQVDKIDSWAARKDHRVARRCALFLLSKSGAWALETIPKERDGAVAFAEMGERIEEYV